LGSLENSIKEINSRYDQQKIRMKTEEDIYDKQMVIIYFFLIFLNKNVMSKIFSLYTNT